MEEEKHKRAVLRFLEIIKNDEGSKL